MISSCFLLRKATPSIDGAILTPSRSKLSIDGINLPGRVTIFLQNTENIPFTYYHGNAYRWASSHE